MQPSAWGHTLWNSAHMAAESTRPMLVTAASRAEPPGHPSPDPEIMAALSKDHRQRRLRLVGLVVLAAVAVGVIAAFAIRGARAPRLHYVTSTVSRGTLLMPVSASGSVEPKNAVDVGADISGRVDKVFVEANDRVEKGALLARLQTDVLDLAVKQARAAVATAQANRQQAEIAASDARVAIARADALRKSGAMTEVDHQQVESVQRKSLAALAVVDANIAAARAGLEMARANRDKAEIRAPISGIVLRRSVEPGQVVVSALQAAVLFRLAEDLAHLEVRADIDEADVGRVEAGQEATFTVSAAPEQTYRARVRSVSNAPQVMQQVVTYEAILDVENADGTLRPGMTASVKVQTGAIDNALLVPSVALRFAPTEEKAREKAAAAGPPKTTVEKAAPKATRVWILDGQTPVAREVVIVGSDGERTAVTGLEEGAAVILSEKARS
jgi:HlyD family secretion protein